MISIVMPCYNCETSLVRTAECIRAQTVADWELIAVDDGSSDGTGAALDALARADARIRVIHQENGGVSRARNAGMAAARGEWLAFADADDVLPPDALATLLALDDGGADILCGAYTIRYTEDVLFNLDAFYAARSWRMTRQSVYRYDLGGDSAMTRAKGQVYESAKPMLCGITRFIRKNGLQTALFRAHIDIYLRTLRNDRGRRGAASAFDRAVAACVTEGVRFSELGAKQKAYYIALRVCPRTSYFLP